MQFYPKLNQPNFLERVRKEKEKEKESHLRHGRLDPIMTLSTQSTSPLLSITGIMLQLLIKKNDELAAAQRAGIQ